MGRKRTINHDLPPRMNLKGKMYYHVSTDMPRKWTKLGHDLSIAKRLWAEIEGEPVGHTEDIELLRSLSSLIALVGWTKGKEWTNKVREGKAGRDVIRTALQVAKKAVKEEKAAQAIAAGNVSHAKPRTPPPPPVWTIDDAMDDLNQALNYIDNDLSAVELLATWTTEQQQEIKAWFNRAAAPGDDEYTYTTIKHLVMKGFYGTPYNDLDLLAMIKGYSGKPLEWPGFLEELQCPREKA